MSERPTIVDQEDVRQGKSGVGVRQVLTIGLALVIVAFIALYFILKATS